MHSATSVSDHLFLSLPFLQWLQDGAPLYDGTVWHGAHLPVVHAAVAALDSSVCFSSTAMSSTHATHVLGLLLELPWRVPLRGLDGRPHWPCISAMVKVRYAETRGEKMNGAGAVCARRHLPVHVLVLFAFCLCSSCLLYAW